MFYPSFFIEVQLTEEGETNMNTTEAEKDWLRRISRKEPSDRAEKQVRKVAKDAVEQTHTPLKKKGNGFGDVAGMNELKQRVTEGFINVLQNRDYGLFRLTRQSPWQG